MARTRARRKHPGPPFDLFGEIAVTWSEVFAWCAAIAGLPADSPRLARYVLAYDVPGKIRRAKLAGTLAELLEPAAAPVPVRLAAVLELQPGTRTWSGFRPWARVDWPL